MTWLAPHSFSERHEIIRSKRVETTGLCFLNSGTFKNWENEEGSQLLVCRGIGTLGLFRTDFLVAGAGKTFLRFNTVEKLNNFKLHCYRPSYH
jgi:hypothetical protein